MRINIVKIKKAFKNPGYFITNINRYFQILKLWIIYALCFPIKSYICQKNIWLIREKGIEARDNGYHLYKYIRENHQEINAYYVISKHSSDLQKVSIYDNIIKLNSLKHFIYFLYAKASINSQPYGAAPDPSGMINTLSRKIRRKDQVVVFLQHGVTKDEIPHSLDYNKTHFDLWCCSSPRECNYIMQTYTYPEDNVKVLGLCRYDNLLLEHKTKKQILVMPTHRMWLHSSNTATIATHNERKEFEKTDYYNSYANLLTNAELLNSARQNGYKIVFYPHYALQSFIQCFEDLANDVVVVADRKQYDVQELLIESSLLITDYSSVFFDFAYMEKPIIYYQFDDEKYHKEHFKEGYFNFYEDGYGPICKSSSEVIQNTLEQIEKNCIMNDIYRHRAENFFTLRDINNCQRTFEEISRKALKK